jgi:hypothetical protein
MFRFVFEEYLPNYRHMPDPERIRTWHILSAFTRSPAQERRLPELHQFMQKVASVYLDAPKVETMVRRHNHGKPLTTRGIRQGVSLPSKELWETIAPQIMDGRPLPYPDEEKFNAMLDDLHRVSCRRVLDRL